MATIKEVLNEQRIYAVMNKVPILREAEVPLFEDLIAMYQPRQVLEVGTAIGYSTLLLARHLGPEGHITTIELDEMRCELAKQWIDQAGFTNRIQVLQGDATELISSLKGPFDLVFLDGPKGQYLKQLQAILPKLTVGAAVLADNVLFRGYVRGDKEVPHRFRTIAKRLRMYLETVEDKSQFNTTIYPMGDGMSVSIWKGQTVSHETDY